MTRFLRGKCRLILVMGLLVGSTAHAQDSLRAPGANDSVYAAALMSHLRANFDDIHDVSMRFHHLDHRLNGLIVLHLAWAGGRLTSSSLAGNETGSRAFGEAMATAVGRWNVPGLTGPFEIDLPLRIRIVGSDDSTFSAKGILTGEIRGRDGAPIRDAVVRFTSAGSAGDTLRPCYSNREGIFVKTLIPAGAWNVECGAQGCAPVVLRNVRFTPGVHVRKTIALQRAK